MKTVRRSNRLYASTKWCMLALLLMTSVNALPSAYGGAEGGVVTQTRNFTRVITGWGGWVLEVNVSTQSPWVVGDFANLSVRVVAREAAVNSTLSVTVVELATDSLRYSKYLGVFKKVNDVREVLFSILLIDPHYIKFSPGGTILRNVSIKLEGYVDTGDHREYYTTTLPVPINLIVPLTNVKMDLDSPRQVKLGDYITLNVKLRNIGITEVNNMYVMIYDNISLVDARYVGVLTPGSVANLYFTFRPVKEGLYQVVVRAVWTCPTGANTSTVGLSEVIVKRETRIYAYTDVSKTAVYSPIRIFGNLIPSVSNALVVIEGSTDLGSTWSVLGSTTSNVLGQYSYVWAPEKPGIYLVRARYPGSDVYFEAVSDVITVSVLKATPKITLSSNKQTLKTGSVLELLITVEPPLSMDISIDYNFNGTGWRKYSVVNVTNGTGKVTWIPIASGSYVFRAVFQGNTQLNQAESQAITIQVIEARATTSQPTTSPEGSLLSETQRQYVIVAALIVSSLVGVLLWLRSRGIR